MRVHLRRGSSIYLSILLVLAVAAATGCGRRDLCEGVCDCRGNECVCSSSGDCYVECVADCALQCAGSGACEFHCGAGCQVACTGNGPCTAFVGDGSAVSCTGSGGCHVVCGGGCSVACPGSGVCVVECAPGAPCELTGCSGGARSCPGDVVVCGGACP